MTKTHAAILAVMAAVIGALLAAVIVDNMHCHNSKCLFFKRTKANVQTGQAQLTADAASATS